MSSEIVRCDDKNAVIERTSRDAADVLRAADDGRLDVSLTGGGVGIAIVAELARTLTRFDFSRLHLWFSDERYLPVGDPDRNDTQAFKAASATPLLHNSRWHVYVGSESGMSAEDAAKAMQKEIQTEAPNFVLSLLGVGPDGHVASLFPSLPGISANGTGVIAVHDSPKPPPTRLSFTRELINSSARVWTALAGSDKADAAKLALSGTAPASESPAGSVAGTEQTRWYLDSAAASEL